MLVSNVGTWMQTTAQVLLLIRISGRGTAIGLVTACQFFPLLVLGPYAGVLADRVNRRRMTITTQGGLTVQAFVLAALDLTGHVSLPIVAGLALVLGTLNALDNPARRGVVTELVDAADVASALSLNTAVMTGARVFGPALGGFLVHAVGTGWCFMANGFSFLAVLTGLLLMNPAELHVAPRTPRGGRPLRDALGFVWRDALLRRTFVALAVVSTFAYSFTVSLPLLVERNLGGGDLAVGWLMAVNSVGSVIGSLVTASRRHIGPWFVALALAVLGVFDTALGASPTLFVAFAIAVPMGAGGTAFVASTSGILQQHTPPGMRGRVLALQSTAFLGSTFIGAPLTGWIADHAGAGWAVSYGGIITLITLAGYSWVIRGRQGDRERPNALAAAALEPA